MTELVIYRGLPGSGKTTHALAWCAEDRAGRARVNRDELRRMLHEGVWLGHETEKHVVAVRDSAIERLLRAGISVASDDTNLRNDVCRALERLAAQCGATVRYVDMTDVSFDECIHRDAAREKPVGFAVISGMYHKYVKGRPYPLPRPPDPTSSETISYVYVPDSSLPTAWMVDIDGTLALMGDRSPFDWKQVGFDLLNETVASVVSLLYHSGVARVILMSGRDEVCRPETEAWLLAHGVQYHELHMRAEGDNRKDAVVKLELFRERVAPHFLVRGVLDDRDQVVEMWRRIGLPCFQVAAGSF